MRRSRSTRPERLRTVRTAVRTVLVATLLLAPARLLGADPGIAYPSASEASDDKLGSVLIFNVISSGTPSPARNTELSITNHHDTQSAAFQLFFVVGATGVVHRSRLIDLAPNQIFSMQASAIAPALEGYAIAVAFDRVTGCPISFNHLSGRAAIKLPSGHQVDLGAEAVAALYAGTIADCTELSTAATLSFDGVEHNRLAATIAIDNYASSADGNTGLLVLNRIGGDLTASAATLGIAYEAWGSGGSAGNGVINSGASQLRTSPADLLPVQSGETGWVQFDSSGGIAGAFLNFNPNAQVAAGAFNGGRNLHRLALATDSLVVPVVPATPGFPYPAASEASDNRAGSVLIFPFFTTSATMPNSESATLTLTNTHDTTINVKLFFVRGNTGAVNPLATMLLTLPPHASRSVPASAVAAGFRGYVIAVAVEVSTGCPIAFNHLIGDVDVKLGTGHFASLPAIGVAALYTGTVSGCAAGDASLNFDGVDYNLLPRGLALDNTGSSADGNFTLFVLDHIGGDLEAALTPLGTVDGSFYDSDSNPATAFDFNAPPQFLGTFDPGVPAGISAWFEANPALEAAMVGSVLKFNANATTVASAFSGGHNLHMLTLAPDTLALGGPPVSTPTVTSTPRPSATRTTTRTPTRAATSTLAPTVIPTATPLKTPTRTATRAPSATATNPVPTSTRTRTPTGPLPTPTRTRSGTATETAIQTATATVGASATATVRASATATKTGPNATPTSTATGPTPTGTVSPSPNPIPPCVGDCNNNGRVTVDEAIVGVNILLDSLPFSACPAFDRDNTGTVTIDELIQGVDNLLGACPM